jgi:hypothetical protein
MRDLSFTFGPDTEMVADLATGYVGRSSSRQIDRGSANSVDRRRLRLSCVTPL